MQEVLLNHKHTHTHTHTVMQEVLLNHKHTHTHTHTVMQEVLLNHKHTHTHTHTHSQERSLEKLPPLPPSISTYFVRLIELIMQSSLRLDCIRYICDHLLVSDINDLKFISSPSAMDASVTMFDGER